MIRRLFEKLLDGRDEPARAPFAGCPTYEELADMSLEERVRHPHVAVPPHEVEKAGAEPPEQQRERRRGDPLDPFGSGSEETATDGGRDRTHRRD